MRNQNHICKSQKILNSKKARKICHFACQNFLDKILFNKKLFDCHQIFRIFEKHFYIKFLKVLKESDNFLLITIFVETQDIWVNYVTSVQPP